MKLHTLQTDLLTGALDDEAQARSDTVLYKNGAAELVNALPLATGGVVTRWGTAPIAALDNTSDQVLAEFSFSAAQTYLAVIGAGRVDFFYATDGAPAGSVTGGPWTSSNLRSLRWWQAGDLLWLAHPDMPLQEIRRTGAASWSLAPFTYETTQARPSFRYAAASISVTGASYDGNGFAGQLVFSADWLQAGHAGTIVRILDPSTSAYVVALLNTILDGHTAAVTWATAASLAQNQTTTTWEEQAFSAVRGYPRTVAMFQQRLWLGGGRDQGDAIWASRAGRYFNFDVGTARDGDAIAVALGASKARSIRHAVPADYGIVFLCERESFFLPSGGDKPITPATVRVRPAGAYGAAAVPPAYFDGGVLVVQNGGAAVRDYAPNESDTSQLTSQPVSLPFTKSLGTIVDAAYMFGSDARPEQYAFFVNTAGDIILFHSLRAQKIGAWLRWTTPAGIWKSVGVAGQKLWAVCARGGQRWLEVFAPTVNFDFALAVPSQGGVFNGGANLSVLNGQTAHARIGNDYLGSGTVVGGTVTVDRQADQAGGVADGAVAEVGLGFDFRVTPLPPAVDLADGTMLRRAQRVIRTHLRLTGAYSCRVGRAEMAMLLDGFDPSIPPAAQSRWWRATHLGFSKPQNGDGGGLDQKPITRSVPMPCGVLAIKREVIV